MVKWVMISLAILWGHLPWSTALAEEQLVSHTLSFPRSKNQYVQVSSKFPVATAQLELSMPSWTPGSYLIRDYAAHVEQLQAYAPDGRSLAVRKIQKNRWRVEAAGATELRVEYEVWAGILGVADNWVESDVALLNGAGVFLFGEETRSLPQQVTVQLPASWSNVHTSLLATGAPHVFKASDYDELIDSPIVAGKTVAHDFEVDTQPYALVLSNENPLWDSQRAIEDLSRIVRTQQEFWGVDPFNRKFYFFNFFMGNLSGLEHDHSTVLMGSPWQMRGEENYAKWLGLVSHEFFHAWNVRRMRPRALDEYDYDREVYTRELWLAEGVTSYYDNLLLFRAGLIDVSTYLELLAEEFRVYEATPGRQVRSAELASFDTWIKQYQPDNNTANSTVSYYRKGAVIGFITDMAIRRETAGKASLDNIMRALYARYGQREAGQRGYPPGAFEDEIESIAGPGVRKVVEDMLRSTDDPDIEGALAWLGLSLQRQPYVAAKKEQEKPGSAGVGIKWDDAGLFLLADEVMQGYAGAEAGILPGDELLAIDGMRVTPADVQGYLKKLKPGEEADFTLVRHGRLMTLPVLMKPQMSEVYSIVPSAKIRNREKARLESWLGKELKITR
jgi:predicted metalloprotease with PDZ domain